MTSPESPSVSCCTTGGRLTRATRDTSAFLLPRRAGDLPETPRVAPNGGCLPYPRPHPRTEPCAYRVCLPKSGCIYARASFATCSTTSHFLLDHRMLMFECPSSNECQMLQRLAIFIRAVGRVAAQADSTTACQNALVANLPSDCWSANNPSFKSAQHVSRPVGYAKRSHAINQPSLHL